VQKKTLQEELTDKMSADRDLAVSQHGAVRRLPQVLKSGHAESAAAELTKLTKLADAQLYKLSPPQLIAAADVCGVTW
jgi:hypothetical protein